MRIVTKILNKILSKKLILKLILIKNLKLFLSNYYYDFKRFIFSSSTLKVISEKNIESKISANYHSLENNDVSNCTLNWSVEIEKDKKLRNLINILNSEIIIMMIAIGTPPEKYLVANSHKRDVDEVLFYL